MPNTSPFTESVSENQTGFDIPVELHMFGDAARIVAARIRRVSQSLFELSCSEKLHEGQRLTLSHEGRRIEVEVVSAEQSASEVYVLAAKVVRDEVGQVRSELRLPTDLSAIVRVAGLPNSIAARIVDMSPSGMRIELPVSLMPGAKICVNLDQGLAFGEIRFCRQRALDLYSVGFKLEEYICQEESSETKE